LEFPGVFVLSGVDGTLYGPTGTQIAVTDCFDGRFVVSKTSQANGRRYKSFKAGASASSELPRWVNL
jgi:hypothetical protein